MLSENSIRFIFYKNIGENEYERFYLSALRKILKILDIKLSVYELFHEMKVQIVFIKKCDEFLHERRNKKNWE